MTPLERLFALELEYYRQWRESGWADMPGLHTSWALELGYERLMIELGRVTPLEVDQLKQRMLLAGDVRDVLAAGDAVMRLLVDKSATV